MAERLIVPSWLHEPSGGATFDNPSICYQHPDSVDGQAESEQLASFRMVDQRTSQPDGP
jgi:hypothetical protein